MRIPYIIMMIVLAGILFWNNTSNNPNLWIKIACFVLFFLLMMKLSAKTPSKNKDNTEE
jgi:surface polysaccharide O-acyltransferase-like enzyme